MIRGFVCFLIWLLSLCAYSQKRTEVGINVGMSSYYGDLNESQLFFNPSYYYGILIKRNFNERYALKLELKNVNLGVNQANFEFASQIYSSNSFESQVWDVALQTEFNFLPYNPLDVKNYGISPYITAGLGLGYIRNASSFFITIPFGLGMKVKINKRIGVASEWTFRKTFTDKIDGGNESIIANEKPSRIHNNDWYTVIGLIVTYNVSKLRIDCPAYE